MIVIQVYDRWDEDSSYYTVHCSESVAKKIEQVAETAGLLTRRLHLSPDTACLRWLKEMAS